MEVEIKLKSDYQDSFPILVFLHADEMYTALIHISKLIDDRFSQLPLPKHEERVFLNKLIKEIPSIISI